MSILSLEFLLLAACTVLLYYLLPLRIRWAVLLATSAVYVGLSGWHSAAHLTVVALLMWGGGLLLERKRSRLLLALLVGLDMSAMLLLKYAPIAQELLVPVGLSYFTFQSAGYLVDVYRGKAQAQKNPLRAWLFVGYFPQLAQGPISTWKELGPQLITGHRLEPEQFVSGFTLLLWGYFKKLVIADRLAATTDALLAGGSLPGWFVLGGVVLYTVRLYMDFSGGMDAVRGLSRMMGIELPENFRRPFFATSVADYWRRWHITLGKWFRAYLLYPLTTSRAGIALGRLASKSLGKRTGRAVPSALATLLVFLLIGLWHAANWNAVIYGAYFGLVMASSMLLEPVWKTMRVTLRLPQGGFMTPLRIVRTWGLILLAQYLLEQWPYLTACLEDGRLEISNNRAERSIKPFVIDRKNFLFANTPGGAQGSAIIFSMIETAKENGLDPYKYLLHILQTAPAMNLERDVQRLLPWNVQLNQ